MRRCAFLLSAALYWFTSFSQNIGSRVSILAVDGKTYTGIVKHIQGDRYRVKYEGYDFEAWLSRDQFTLLETPPAVQPVVQVDISELDVIFDFGRLRGWTSPLLEAKWTRYIATLTEKEKANLLTFFKKANTPSARFFVLKSLMAGDDFSVLEKFIESLNAHTESVQQERCLITNRRSIIQQWEYSCSVTTVQTYLGDLSPRYAWEVRQVPNYDKVAYDPKNPMAVQQKQLLEYYGGVASPRGDASGKAIGILGPLNDLVGPVVGMRFSAEVVTEEVPVLMARVRKQIDAGLGVPLLINFIGTEANHFILAMKYRKTASGYQYLIYDPWDGVCDYVSENMLTNNSLSPLLTSWKIKITYYYPAVPMSEAEINEILNRRKHDGF